MYLTPQALRASSPKREAAPAPQGAAEVSGRVPSPRRALPLLGEVARSAEGVSGVGCGAGGKRQDAVQTILFPIGSRSALSVLAALGHLSQRERQGRTRFTKRCCPNPWVPTL